MIKPVETGSTIIPKKWSPLTSFPDANLARLPDLVKQKYEDSHRDALVSLEDKINQETRITNALQSFSQAQVSTTSATAGTSPGRTMASPEWGPNECLNINKRIPVTGVPVVDFDSGNEPLSCTNQHVIL